MSSLTFRETLAKTALLNPHNRLSTAKPIASSNLRHDVCCLATCASQESVMSGSVASLSVVLIALSASACSLPMLLQKNLAAIEASTATIAANNDVVKHSTNVTEQGIKSFEGLRGPMESVATLGPDLEEVAALNQPMRAVAKLDDPMKKVATLAAPMREVAALERSMTRLADLDPSLNRTAALGPSMDLLSQMRPSLDEVAALRDPMIQVASLRTDLGAVADLRTPMTELTTLRQPLERVADLRQPLEGVAGLGRLLEHPLLIALLILVGLALWGAVTFVAVRLAIVSAAAATLPGPAHKLRESTGSSSV